MARFLDQRVLFVVDAAHWGELKFHGLCVKVVGNVGHHRIRAFAVSNEKLHIAFERVHVTAALTKERLGGHVELIDFTSWVTGHQYSDTALEAACATLTVFTRAYDVLGA